MRNSILLVLFGMFLGLGVYTYADSVSQEASINTSDISCDAMEEIRLKMALNECADTVMIYAWGDIGESW